MYACSQGWLALSGLEVSKGSVLVLRRPLRQLECHIKGQTRLKLQVIYPLGCGHVLFLMPWVQKLRGLFCVACRSHQCSTKYIFPEIRPPRDLCPSNQRLKLWTRRKGEEEGQEGR